MNVPEGQMCETGCGCKATFLCGTSIAPNDNGGWRHLWTCFLCGCDVRPVMVMKDGKMVAATHEDCKN